MSTEKSDTVIYDVSPEWAERAHVDASKYKEMYEFSASRARRFWGHHGKRIDWIKPFTKVKNTCFDPGKVSIKWFEDGITNVSTNCIDRHLAERADQIAIIWEGDDPGESQEDHLPAVARAGLPLRQRAEEHGVKKGDRVTIYLPMIPEAAYAMLACARIGAVHSVVFGGFSPDSLAGRIEDCKSKVVITADEGLRGGKQGPAQGQCRRGAEESRRHRQDVIVVKRTGGPIDWVDGRDVWYDDEAAKASSRLPARPNERGGSAVHPLHVGLHRQAEGRVAHHRRLSRLCVDDASVRLRLSRRRYLLVHGRCRLGHRPQLHRLRPAGQRRDHADVRGHPELPDDVAVLGGDRQAQGQHLLYRADRDPRADGRGRGAGQTRPAVPSLRLLGSVGEPINPEAWLWYHRVVGDGRCPIVDTWWQTETGGILITPLPGATA